IYSLDGWKPGGGKEQELDFWMEEPVPPRPARVGGAGSGGAAQQPNTAGRAAKKRAVKKTPKKAAKKPTKRAAAKASTKKSVKKSPKKAKAK
ncbi:hypothetical protein ABTF57_17700, partial [Acinetobacter baumannii]